MGLGEDCQDTQTEESGHTSMEWASEQSHGSQCSEQRVGKEESVCNCDDACNIKNIKPYEYELDEMDECVAYHDHPWHVMAITLVQHVGQAAFSREVSNQPGDGTDNDKVRCRAKAESEQADDP